MIGEKISRDSEHYCTRHKIALLEEAVIGCYCRNCKYRIVRKKETVPLELNIG